MSIQYIYILHASSKYLILMHHEACCHIIGIELLQYNVPSNKWNEIMFHIRFVKSIHTILFPWPYFSPKFKFGLEKKVFTAVEMLIYFPANYYSKVPLLIIYGIFLISTYENPNFVIMYKRNLIKISESTFSRHPHLVTMFSILDLNFTYLAILTKIWLK